MSLDCVSNASLVTELVGRLAPVLDLADYAVYQGLVPVPRHFYGRRVLKR